MKRFRNHLITGAAVLVLALIGTLMNSHQSELRAAGGGPTVTIDATQLPLPVKGSISITGTPTFSFSNTAASPLFTRDTDNPARRPFQTSLCSAIGLGQTPGTCSSTPSSFTVASDQRLVIEFASARCFTGPVGPNALNLLTVGLGTRVGGTSVEHALPLVLGLGEFEAAQQTRIYADAGTLVSIGMSAGAGATNTSATCFLALSGSTITP